jgi:hypothetical protein
MVAVLRLLSMLRMISRGMPGLTSATCATVHPFSATVHPFSATVYPPPARARRGGERLVTLVCLSHSVSRSLSPSLSLTHSLAHTPSLPLPPSVSLSHSPSRSRSHSLALSLCLLQIVHCDANITKNNITTRTAHSARCAVSGAGRHAKIVGRAPPPLSPSRSLARSPSRSLPVETV